MPTLKQIKAVEAISANISSPRPKPLVKVLQEVGYSKSVSKSPTLVTESVGFKELCAQIGLTEDFLISALTEDIANKKGNRRGEIELGLKVLGKLKGEDAPPSIVNNTQINIASKDVAEKFAKLMEQETEIQ